MRALVVIILLAATASADPVGDAIAEQLGATLPDDLGVARVFVPKSLEGVAPASIRVEPLVQPHVGQPSVKVTAKHHTVWVPVRLAKVVDVVTVVHAVAAGTVLTADDVAVEHRAFAGIPAPMAEVVGATVIEDLEAGTPLGAHDLALQPPLPRGTHVSVELVRGSVHVRGSGVLELACRTGEPATVRLAFNQTVVHGTMTAPGVVVVGDLP